MKTGTLRAERAKIIADARAIIDVSNPSEEANAKFDLMMESVDSMKAQIDRLEKADTIEAELGQTIGATAERAHTSVWQEEDGLVREKRIITGMLRGGVRALAPADREHVIKRMEVQNTAMSTAVTGNAAGFTISPLFFAELQVAMKAQGGMRNAARTITTDTGASLPFPLLDDRSNVATIIAENASISEDTELTFSQLSLGGYTYKSGVLLVSLQLLNDSAFDFDGVIRDAIAGRFVRGQNAHFTTGTGTSQPKGAVTAATLGKTGVVGQTLSVVYADLADMIHAVDPFYRQGSKWMMNDSSIKVIRKITDSQSRPLWQPGLIDGEPDTLMGFPLVTNQDMAVMAANAKSILFGNFNYYFIRDVATSVQLLTLRERYADFLQVGYIAFLRSDGNLISAAAPIAYYANSAT